MAPTKFLPGDLVLVKFPQYGYWPAQITGVLKKSRREVKCFGEGERGEALPRDMIYFNYASMEANISKSSCDKDPARKKALMQILNKFKKQGLQNNNDEPAHKKAQKQTSDKIKKQVLNNNDEPTRKKALTQTSDQNKKQSLKNNESSARKEPLARKKDLKQTSDKYVKQILQNNNDEPTRKKPFKQTFDKIKKQSLKNNELSAGKEPLARKKSLKQTSDKYIKQVLQNNDEPTRKKAFKQTFYKNKKQSVKNNEPSARKEPLARKKALKQTSDKYKKQTLQNSNNAKLRASKKAPKQFSDKNKKQVLQNNKDENGGGTKTLDTMAGDHQVANDERNRAINDLGNIQSDNEIVKRRCPSDEEIEDIREKVKTDYEVKLEEIRVKLKADYEEKLKEICVKAHDDYEQKLQEIRVKVQDDYEQKLQRFSSVHEQKIGDLEAWLCEEMSAAAGANRQIEEYKIMLENMAATVASLELLNESLEQNIKNHTQDLEDRIVKFKAEVSNKFDEIKLLNDQVRQLKKEKEELVEKNIALEDEVSLMGEDQNNGRGMEIEGNYVNKIVNCRIM